MIDNPSNKKPFSIAVEELYNSKVKIVGEEENQEEKLEEGLDGDFDEDTEI